MISESFFKGLIPCAIAFAKVCWSGKTVVCKACGYDARIFHFAVCPKCGAEVKS